MGVFGAPTGNPFARKPAAGGNRNVLGDIGVPQQAPGVDLSFLNDPNNPYYQGGGGGGGGDYGGGGGASTYDNSGTGSGYAQTEIPAVKPILEQSPEWIAYLNSLGLEKAQFAADIERQRALAGAKAKFQSESLKPQYDEQRRNISSANESRGMARSGKQLRDISVSRAGENRQQAGIYQGLTGTLSQLESDLAQKNLDLEVQKRQQEASMLSNGYQHLDYGALGSYLKSRG